jgi:hypothetical protein
MVFGLDLKGGVCPWCGSDRVHGRSGHQDRHCNNCHVTFDDECPLCHSEHNSWAYNAKEGEYGCDRCHKVATSDELELRRSRRARYP